MSNRRLNVLFVAAIVAVFALLLFGCRGTTDPPIHTLHGHWAEGFDPMEILAECVADDRFRGSLSGSGFYGLAVHFKRAVQ